jgi:hypothetical protein
MHADNQHGHPRRAKVNALRRDMHYGKSYKENREESWSEPLDAGRKQLGCPKRITPTTDPGYRLRFAGALPQASCSTRVWVPWSSR